ncbi:hypothetical protein BKA69DRAFT_1123428 [Paraphysoderma sedebokerense]|nr:hypothetical protein BKA69DRAFT_1123428 [Paraphysoderma sedebokerense]
MTADERQRLMEEGKLEKTTADSVPADDRFIEPDKGPPDKPPSAFLSSPVITELVLLFLLLLRLLLLIMPIIPKNRKSEIVEV